MKSSLRIAAGIAGAVAGFIATIGLLELTGFGNRADPITTGLVALFVIAPIGAVDRPGARHQAGDHARTTIAAASHATA